MNTLAGSRKISRITAIATQKGIVTFATFQHIIARKAGQHVIAGIAAQGIVKNGTGNIFNALQGVIPITTGNGIVLQAGRNTTAFIGVIGRINAIAALQVIITRTTGKRVISRAAIQRIVAGPANNAVIAGTGRNGIIPVQRIDDITAIRTRQTINIIGAKLNLNTLEILDRQAVRIDI